MVPTDDSRWEKSFSFRLLTFSYFDLVKIIQKCQLSPLSSLREKGMLEDEIEIWDVVPRAHHAHSRVFNQSRMSSVKSCGTFGWGLRFCCRSDQLIVRAPFGRGAATTAAPWHPLLSSTSTAIQWVFYRIPGDLYFQVSFAMPQTCWLLIRLDLVFALNACTWHEIGCSSRCPNLGHLPLVSMLIVV